MILAFLELAIERTLNKQITNSALLMLGDTQPVMELQVSDSEFNYAAFLWLSKWIHVFTVYGSVIGSLNSL
jgi:hypothetical protein